MSSKFALNPADVATTDRYDPSNNIYPKTIMDKIRRLHYTFGITTGFILLDPWEMSLKKLNYQYEVTTGLYMLESWEKYIVNGVVCAGFALVAYATINHLPSQSVSLLQQLSAYTA